MVSAGRFRSDSYTVICIRLPHLSHFPFDGVRVRGYQEVDGPIVKPPKTVFNSDRKSYMTIWVAQHNRCDGAALEIEWSNKNREVGFRKIE